jgi:hypothetical protein
LAADSGVVVGNMGASEGYIGFDAARKVNVNRIEAGIIDPAKVVGMPWSTPSPSVGGSVDPRSEDTHVLVERILPHQRDLDFGRSV